MEKINYQTINNITNITQKLESKRFKLEKKIILILIILILIQEQNSVLNFTIIKIMNLNNLVHNLKSHHQRPMELQSCKSLEVIEHTHKTRKISTLHHLC